MVCGGIKCGNAMDIKSGPPPWFRPLNVFRPGSEGGFGQKVHGLILIRTANRLLFFSAGRLLVILKSAEGKLQLDGHLASHYPPRVEQDCLAAFFYLWQELCTQSANFWARKDLQFCGFNTLWLTGWRRPHQKVDSSEEGQKTFYVWYDSCRMAVWPFYVQSSMR